MAELGFLDVDPCSERPASAPNFSSLYGPSCCFQVRDFSFNPPLHSGGDVMPEGGICSYHNCNETEDDKRDFQVTGSIGNWVHWACLCVTG